MCMCAMQAPKMRTHESLKPANLGSWCARARVPYFFRHRVISCCLKYRLQSGKHDQRIFVSSWQSHARAQVVSDCSHYLRKAVMHARFGPRTTQVPPDTAANTTTHSGMPTQTQICTRTHTHAHHPTHKRLTHAHTHQTPDTDDRDTHAHIDTDTHTNTHTHTRTHTHADTHTHTRRHTHKHTRTQTHTPTPRYTQVHTHTRTHLSSSSTRTKLRKYRTEKRLQMSSMVGVRSNPARNNRMGIDSPAYNEMKRENTDDVRPAPGSASTAHPFNGVAEQRSGSHAHKADSGCGV